MKAPVQLVTVGAAVVLAVLGVRQSGALQPLELWAYDRMVQLRPDQGPDPRLLIVTVTQADLQRQKRYLLSDAVLAKTLASLERQGAAVIGLDIYRDLPVEPGHQALRKLLMRSDRIFAVMKLGEGADGGYPHHRVYPQTGWGLVISRWIAEASPAAACSIPRQTPCLFIHYPLGWPCIILLTRGYS
ncbi:CHASE2 domain-containing protein [Candidatus Cyanaurora vandensis]|uniref:CHASE2 domain-containing protein n=1 Tax=Candidatus Cyanaurora vandensis TaxID=2714958 RepID=UPI0025811139|nr:CHASE2 domain-containing protein [Candidatus Cyanaurora vandensis]